MKITIESTSKIVSVVAGSSEMPARVWEGTTESGIPVHVFITRVSPTIPTDDPRQEEFGRELQECRTPSGALAVIPARLIL